MHNLFTTKVEKFPQKLKLTWPGFYWPQVTHCSKISSQSTIVKMTGDRNLTVPPYTEVTIELDLVSTQVKSLSITSEWDKGNTAVPPLQGHPFCNEKVAF